MTRRMGNKERKKWNKGWRKAIWSIVIVAVCIFSIVLVFSMLMKKQQMTQNFKESNKKLLNPERGYYWQVESSRKEKFSKLEEEGYRLTLLTFDLQDYKDAVLPKEKLLELEGALAEAGMHHIAVIFRAAYGFDKIPNEPEELGLMGTHISQIASVLNKYSDNIICVQAGMLGAYGEWHSGKFLTDNETESKKVRNYVLQQWEKYLGKDIEVAVRRPRFIREAEGILTNRLGFHNDAFLSTDDDMGTYDDINYTREEELEWTQRELRLKKNGGEMPLLCENSQPENADYEFGKIHVSYLNRSYQEKIFDKWNTLNLHNQNAESYINNHLGYRLYIAQIEKWKELSKFPFAYFSMPFKVAIVNSGYSPLDSKYKVYLVVETEGERKIQETTEEGFYSICNGEMIEFKLNLGVTGRELNGTKVRIGIKIAETPEDGEEDSIRLANEEFIWEDGINWILQY